jgi:hypothetical protein
VRLQRGQATVVGRKAVDSLYDARWPRTTGATPMTRRRQSVHSIWGLQTRVRRGHNC